MWHCSLLVFLLAAAFHTVTGSAIQQRFGKVNITESNSDGFYCDQILFSTPFQSGSTVKVFPSLSHENHPDIANDPSVVMVTSVNERTFDVCIMEPSQPNGKVSLNWFAFSDNTLTQGIQTGSVAYNMFTSGSSCSDVTFTRSFFNPPKLLFTVRHDGNNQRKDSMSLWAEDVTENQFRVCLREMVSFSGIHENFHVDWVALSNTFSANMTDLSSVDFSNNGQPSLENNYAYCQIENFTRRFHEPPVVLINANRRQDLSSSLSDQNIVAWVKNVDRTSFEVCLKDLPGISGQHEPIRIDYAAIGDLDPCLDVTCDYFAVCRAFGPYDPRCVCVEPCPSTEQNVCASNGQSFDNVCFFQLEVCRTSANYFYYHHGSCRGFPMVRGRRYINQVPLWSDSHCQSVRFEPLTFYPDKPVHVQLSVSHVNDSSQVHDAAVSWVEDVSENGFTFCVMEAGRNEGPPHGYATVEWMAYQGAPQGGVSGLVSIDEWWTGTKCQTVDISSNGFGSAPTVLVTAEHQRRSIKHDAASLWLEDVTSSSFKVCLRELQNFDGAHQDISVNWLAFEELERPLFTEHGSTDFAQTSQNPLANSNYAQCQDVSLSANYISPPTVLLSPEHDSSGGNLDPQYNGISAWIESITTSSFKMCFKEFFNNNLYDPVTVTYAVLRDICDPGWIYYKGYCYERVQSCQTWTNASATCMADSSNLVGIESAEEDVFVQHLHRGEESWIGLNDQANEGVYLWTDGGPLSYTHWGQGISSPSNNDDADCVDSSGRENDYIWQSTYCQDCKNFTCKKDYDECTMDTHECDLNADCVNTVGSYTCQCRNGYTGNGRSCTDINECSEGTHTCDSNADCSNNAGSHSCQCRNGYIGDGWTCIDIDECSQGAHTCHSNAYCINNVGSYTCQCNTGYNGNGWTCSIVNCGDPGSPSRGYTSGSSFTYGSTVYFYCYYSGEVLSGQSYATCQADYTWSNPTPLLCASYNIRLAGNSGYSNKGRVEVHHPSYGWGTVCDDGWDSNDGYVVCRQLGYSGVSAVYQSAHYGQGTGTILLDDLGCGGYESRLWDCSHAGWNVDNCSHGEDASVDCY